MIRAIGLFLLLLLKILGWVLLILLLFLIAAVLLVLFVPVRYDVRIQNERSREPGQNSLTAGLRVQLKASWLLHLFHVSVGYGPEGMQNKIRVAGIDVQKVLARFAKRSAAKADDTGQMQPKTKDSSVPFDMGTETEKDGQDLEEPVIDFDIGTETGKDAQDLEEPVIETEKVQPAEEQVQYVTEESDSDAGERGGSSKASSKTVSHKHRKKKISKKTEKPGILTKIRTQLNRLHKEFTDEGNRHAVSHLWKELLKLLRSYKPRKLKADLTFSLANPALTGGAVGIISLMPWIYRYPCSVIPDFTSEKLYIEGEILARGKVTVFIFALSLLRLLRDKQLMQAVKRLKRG